MIETKREYVLETTYGHARAWVLLKEVVPTPNHDGFVGRFSLALEAAADVGWPDVGDVLLPGFRLPDSLMSEPLSPVWGLSARGEKGLPARIRHEGVDSLDLVPSFISADNAAEAAMSRGEVLVDWLRDRVRPKEEPKAVDEPSLELQNAARLEVIQRLEKEKAALGQVVAELRIEKEEAVSDCKEQIEDLQKVRDRLYRELMEAGEQSVEMLNAAHGSILGHVEVINRLKKENDRLRADLKKVADGVLGREPSGDPNEPPIDKSDSLVSDAAFDRYLPSEPPGEVSDV